MSDSPGADWYEPPDEWEWWCDGYRRDPHPVNSDTDIVEQPDGDYLCQCCFESFADHIQEMYK